MKIITSKILLVAGILFSLPSWAQRQSIIRDSIKEYYEIINNAELSIIDSNYRNASKLYAKAFALKYPNGKDLYNGFMVSYFLQDTFQSKKYLIQLAQNGLKKQFILHNGRALETPFFNYLSKDYDSIYNNFQTIKASRKIIALDSLGFIDQMILKSDTNLSAAEIKHLQFQNLDRLKNWITKNGFPSFKNTGFYEDYNPSPRTLPTDWYLLWHVRPSATQLDDTYKNAVLAGDFRPDLYALIIDQRGEHYWTLLPRDFKESINKYKINDARKQIYLESIDDYIEKIKFSFHNKDFIFLNIFSILLNKDKLSIK